MGMKRRPGAGGQGGSALPSGVWSSPPLRGLEAAPRTARIGIVRFGIVIVVAVITVEAIARAEAEAKAWTAIDAIDARVAALAAPAMLALAATDEVIVAVFTRESARVAVVLPAATPAAEAPLRAIRALERVAAPTSQIAIGRLTRGALVGTLLGIRRGRFTGGSGLQALFELRAIGGELLLELVTECAQALAASPQARVVGIFVGAGCHAIAAAFHVVGVELALLAQGFGRASQRGRVTRRWRGCRRAAREQQQSSQRDESHAYLQLGGTRCAPSSRVG
jgi:hypothetical protein